MNTKNVYISSLSKVSNIDSDGLKSYALGFKHLKYVLVKINDVKHICTDLNTLEVYEISEFGNYNVGNICLNPNYIRPFNFVTGNTKKYLSKKKILKMYNSIERYK